MHALLKAHGTGTPLGDPAEFSAIGQAFAPYRTDEEPLYVYVPLW